ncbi:MAG: excinuclease ABC subunit UvrC [Deltaproteobacteria bacterium]|nr:excinuclease ABC subunit UvrC [Deltaproteobacteria bacterium]
MITELKEKILLFPDSCGVYIMRDGSGKPLYVGKAKSLRNRVMQYLPPASDNRYFIELLGKNVSDIEVIITSSEREALLLENELIKKLKPKYNIRLRDDKNYVSVRIDKESDYPRIDIVRGQKKDGAVYFGPFVSSFNVRELVKLLRITFRIRICRDAEFRQRKRPCIQYQIKRCDAPCVNKSEELKIRYRDSIERCIRILSGRDKDIVRELTDEMNRFSEELKYEEAAGIRDIIKVISSRSDVQNIININAPDSDVFGLKRSDNYVALFLIKFRGGKVAFEQSFIFEDVYQDENELFEDILTKLYLNSADIPDEILLPDEVDNKEELESILSESVKHVSVRTARGGFRRNLLELASRNAEFRVQEFLNRNSLLYRMKTRFGLRNLPVKIECYDISHLGGEYSVGAKVVAKNGKLLKDEYRRYRIKSNSQGDDYLALFEVIKRRMSHKEEDYPDLILVDGGRGQLSTVIKAISDSEPDKKIDVLAIAKKGEENSNRIYRPGSKNYIRLDENEEAGRLLILLRDEAHRFANDYRERLYRKENL